MTSREHLRLILAMAAWYRLTSDRDKTEGEYQEVVRYVYQKLAFEDIMDRTQEETENLYAANRRRIEEVKSAKRPQSVGGTAYGTLDKHPPTEQEAQEKP